MVIVLAGCLPSLLRLAQDACRTFPQDDDFLITHGRDTALTLMPTPTHPPHHPYFRHRNDAAEGGDEFKFAAGGKERGKGGLDVEGRGGRGF